jgi:type IV pilus assembly protein PilE
MNKHKGFTLLELMIVIVIVAILAAIAIPNYQSYMIKTRRGAAETCLQQMAQMLERHHASKLTYAGATVADLQCSKELAGHYTFSLTDQAARTDLLSATPQGAQSSKDPIACGILTVDQAGKKGAKNGTADEAAVSACWK